MSYNTNDPFAPAPAYPSIKFPLPGHVVDMFITEIGEWRQAVDFETKLPAVWKSGRPKMQLRILADIDGTEMALYVTQYSNLFEAIQAATVEAGASLAPMGRLWVKYDGNVPVEGNKILKAKAYTAKYKAPAGGGDDPFAASPTPNESAGGPTNATGPAASPDEIPF